MATFHKFEGFIGYVGLGAVNLNTDQFNVYLSNATPSASADDVKTDLAEITIENGYTGPVDIQNAYSEANGTGTMTAVDVVITATGSVGPFRYAVIYDATASDILMGWYDYGEEVTMANGHTFTVDFGASLMTLVPSP